MIGHWLGVSIYLELAFIQVLKNLRSWILSYSFSVLIAMIWCNYLLHIFTNVLTIVLTTRRFLKDFENDTNLDPWTALESSWWSKTKNHQLELAINANQLAYISLCKLTYSTEMTFCALKCKFWTFLLSIDFKQLIWLFLLILKPRNMYLVIF